MQPALSHSLHALSCAPVTVEDLAATVIGRHSAVPVLGGTRPYVNLDNAATTPVLDGVRSAVERFLPVYASVHRGAGYKSALSTEIYERSRRAVAAFAGADPEDDVVVFGRNTSEMLNRLARRVDLGPDRLVLVSRMEHHSNDLPWRRAGQVIRMPTDPRTGDVDLDGVEATLRRAHGRIRLLAVCGASNVTGAMPDVHALAGVAHRYGAKIVVDAAQLAPHRAITMHPAGGARADEALDFVAFSGHKMYAPLGAGVLVGRRDAFESSAPDLVGGGTVDVVTEDAAHWAGSPDRDEVGTPNVVGALALARACRLLEGVGWDALAAHERALTRRALRRLRAIDGVRVYGSPDEVMKRDRVGVVAFNIEGRSHAVVAAALGWEWGIGVRNGCFCAHTYVSELLGMQGDAIATMVERVLAGDRGELPGMVRLSFGLYNTEAEVDYACDAIEQIARRGPRAEYVLDAAAGECAPAGVARPTDLARAFFE